MKKIRAALICVLILAALAAGYVLLPASMQSDSMLAREAAFTCRNAAGEQEKETCYQKTIPPLMDEGLSMERSFDVVQLLIDTDHGFRSCHVLAHMLAGKEVAKDPAKWKEVAMRVPYNECGSGGIHGAFQERFRADAMPDASTKTMTELLDGLCDPHDGWAPVFLERSSCSHAMGHLLLYVTNADVKKSVALCDTLAKRSDFDFRDTCMDGVFMQVYQPLEQEDVNLIARIRDDANNPKTFCAPYRGLAFDACVKESWPVVKGSSTDPKVFQALCEQLGTDDEVHVCARGLMYPVIDNLQFDMAKLQSFCGALQRQDLKDICWGRLASKFIWANPNNAKDALHVCSIAPEVSKAYCLNELILNAAEGMRKGSPQARAVCSGMPEPFKESCIAQTNESL